MFAALVRCVMLSNSSTSLTPRSEGPFSWATHCKGSYTKQCSKCNFFHLNLIRKFCLFIYFFFNLVTAWTNKRELVSETCPPGQRMRAELRAHGRMNQSLLLGTKNKTDVWLYWISRITLLPPFLCWEDMVWEALRTPGNPASDKWGLEIKNQPTPPPTMSSPSWAMPPYRLTGHRAGPGETEAPSVSSHCAETLRRKGRHSLITPLAYLDIWSVWLH